MINYNLIFHLSISPAEKDRPVEVDIDLTDFMLDHLDQLGEAEEREQNQLDSIGEQLLEEANFLINPGPELKTFRVPQRPPKPESRFNLGDIVRVHRSYFGEDPEGLAIVYDREESGYIYLLTREGVDLGAFRPDEQDEQTLTWIQATPGFSYTFRSSSYLERDIRAGAFLQYFPAP